MRRHTAQRTPNSKKNSSECSPPTKRTLPLCSSVSLGDKLQLLALASPLHLSAVEILVDLILHRLSREREPYVVM